jgi:hypothetical protein
MNMRVAFFSGLLLVSVGACYEDVTLTLKEPHIYKGKADVHELDPSAREEKLRARFNIGQLDR